MFKFCDGVACLTTAETTGATKGQGPSLYPTFPTSPPLVAPSHSQAPPVAFADPSRPDVATRRSPTRPEPPLHPRDAFVYARVAPPSRCSATTTLLYAHNPVHGVALHGARRVPMRHRQRARRVLPHSAWRTRSLSLPGTRDPSGTYCTDAATKLSDRVRRQCFRYVEKYFESGESWSYNKYGLFKCTHSRPCPEQFPHKRGPLVLSALALRRASTPMPLPPAFYPPPPSPTLLTSAGVDNSKTDDEKRPT
ncbi:hypothetical protein B0H14DRAFT_3670582 [Mycena olivaceomarginata]|nr:hypothetical protein B0H14DRAFT_3670582 [Mycena olivaceomarginata]